MVLLVVTAPGSMTVESTAQGIDGAEEGPRNHRNLKHLV